MRNKTIENLWKRQYKTGRRVIMLNGVEQEEESNYEA